MAALPYELETSKLRQFKSIFGYLLLVFILTHFDTKSISNYMTLCIKKQIGLQFLQLSNVYGYYNY